MRLWASFPLRRERRTLNSDKTTELLIVLPEATIEPSFADRYSRYIGAADDLPRDLAENLDHYVHAHPKL